MLNIIRLAALAGLAAILLTVETAVSWAKMPAAWTMPAKPFQITDHIYYVGTRGLAAYLIASGKQAVLLDGTLEQNVPLVEASIKALGFELNAIKILINSHAHYDHAAGLQRLKQDTGATFIASEGDRPALEQGRHEKGNIYGETPFPPVKVDRTIADGETVGLGDIRLTAILTPGHTKGCTSWSLTDTDAGRPLRVMFPCSLSVAGNILAGKEARPSIVADYRSSFARLDTMKADVVLPAHPEIADVIGRGAQKTAGRKDAFVDPALLQRIVAEAKTAFEKQLKKDE